MNDRRTPRTRTEITRDLVDAHEWAQLEVQALGVHRIQCVPCSETVALTTQATADIEAALHEHEHTAHE